MRSKTKMPSNIHASVVSISVESLILDTRMLFSKYDARSKLVPTLFFNRRPINSPSRRFHTSILFPRLFLTLRIHFTHFTILLLFFTLYLSLCMYFLLSGIGRYGVANSDEKPLDLISYLATPMFPPFWSCSKKMYLSFCCLSLIWNDLKGNLIMGAHLP